MSDPVAVRTEQLVLASASPRRAALLERLGIRVRAMPASLDEAPRSDETPENLARRLALDKARHVAERVPETLRGLPVLGSDTVVALGDEILGKPADRDDALAMLARLSGRTHDVFTAVAVIASAGVQVAVSRSRVRFRDLEPGEAERYWATGEPVDKAGAYGIQGIGGVFVEHIEGSPTGVMGLPVVETELLLRAAGVDTWQGRRPTDEADPDGISLA